MLKVSSGYYDEYFDFERATTFTLGNEEPFVKYLWNLVLTWPANSAN